MTDAKTVMVKRRNVFLDVPADAVDKYLAKGYDVVDERGNVIKEHVPNDPSALKLAYDKHVAKIAELESEIVKLRAEIAKLKLAKPAKPIEAPVVATAEAEKPVAKKTKKTK